MAGTAVEAWEFDHSCDLGEVVQVATERLVPPSFAGHLLSSYGDSLTVQVTGGAPSGDPRALYYVRGHGSFLLAREERWPPLPGGTRPRLLVTLLAFPQPAAAARDPARR